MTSSTNTPSFHPLILWMLWFPLLMGLFVYRFLFGSGLEFKDDLDQPIHWAAVISLALPVALCIGLRWILLPQLNNPALLLPPFVIGLGLAESPAFLGLFLFKDLESVFFAASVLCLLQFIPLGLEPGSRSADSDLPVKVR